MPPTLIQYRKTQLSVSGDVTLDSTPAPGNLLVMYAMARNGAAIIPATFTEDVAELSSAFAVFGLAMAHRVVVSGDGTTYPVTVPGGRQCAWTVMEWSGLDEPDAVASDLIAAPSDPTPGPIDPGGSGYVIGAVAVMSDIAGRDVGIDAGSVTITSQTTASTFGPKAAIGWDEAGAIGCTATHDAYTYHEIGYVGAHYPELAGGGTGDPDPDPDPYVPPLPAGPILEIYTADPDGDRWGTAVWGTAVWGASGWQDVTPQGVLADVSWGTEDVGLGILARPDAGTWTVTTYDPDRKLDPANDASPYAGYLRPGLKIRISHAGTVLRTGVVTRIAYSYARQTGAIAATDAIATLARAKVPESALAGLSATLWARATDVIDAANVPVSIARGRPEFDAPLSDPPDGERTAWDHIYLASQELLAIPYVRADNRIGWRWWATPLERGAVIDGANLTDLTSIIDGRGLYSEIRALTDTPPTVATLASTPTPDYGERPYVRDVTTIDADAWVAAVLADRSEGGLRFIPGEVACFTAADVDYFAGVEIGELVTMSTPDITVTGRVLGVRFRVAYDQAGPGSDLEPPDWRFIFHVATSESTVLVADYTGDPIVSDTDATEFLIGG